MGELTIIKIGHGFGLQIPSDMKPEDIKRLVVEFESKDESTGLIKKGNFSSTRFKDFSVKEII